MKFKVASGKLKHSLIAVSILPLLSSLESCSKPPLPYQYKAGSSDAGVKEPEEIEDEDEGQEETETQKDPVTTAGTRTDEVPTPVEGPKFVACTEQTAKCSPHQMVLADYSLGRLLYVNLDDPSKDWNLDVPGGARDLQLIGDNKVLVGTVEGGDGPFGWHEVDLATGKIVKSVTGLTGPVMSVQRLANGNTLLIGNNLLGGNGAVVVETNDKKEIVSKREFPGMANFRTVRRSRDGHFFVGNGSNMMEMSADGKEVWKSDVGAQPAYMGLKLASGERVVASGHGGKIFTYDAKTGLKTKTVSLPDIDGTKSMPAFASAFAVLPNGNYVTTNWAGGTKTHGNDGPQVSEYTPDGKLIWSWKQQAERISAIYAVLVLDNLDLSKAHDDTNGPLAPVQLAYP